MPWENIHNLSRAAEEEGREQKFFEVLAEGHFAPENIETRLVEPGSTLKRAPESEAFIEAGWEKEIENMAARGEKPWPNDLKPTKYRLAGFAVEGDKLVVTLDPCVSYRDFRGVRTEEFVQRFGKEALPNPLSALTMVIAKDRAGEEHMLVTLRNPKQDYKPGGYHVSTGGLMDSRRDKTPIDAALGELAEESGILKDELEQFECRGLVYNPWTFHSEIVFRADTRTTIEDIIERRKEKARSKGLTEEEAEGELLFVPTKRVKLQQWLLGPAHAGVPSGLAEILLVGKDLVAEQGEDGERWYEEMRKALAWRSAEYENEAVRDALEHRDSERLSKITAAYREGNKERAFEPEGSAEKE